MIKLKESEAIISLENVRLVKKVSKVDQGYDRSRRWIEVYYTDGNVVQVGYGRDANYYNTNNPKLNADYKQIEEELMK